MTSGQERSGDERDATPSPRLDASRSMDGCYQVIVVGAGIGGLTAAALLARRGYKVLVLEAHYLCGGNCTSWRRLVPLKNGRHPFVFDSGVQDISGLGPDGALTNLLNQIGATDALRWKRVHHLYWQDGITVRGGTSSADFVASLCEAFPEQAQGVRQFMAEMESVFRELFLDVKKTGGIPVPPQAHELRAWLEHHPHAYKWMKQPFSNMLGAFISNSAARNVLRTLAEYITDEPQRLAVQDMAPLFGYYFEGGWYPEGGSQRFSNLLARAVRRHGGEVLLSTKVARILIANGRAQGVETSDGRRMLAPLVIANGDVVSMLTEIAAPSALPASYASRIASLNRGPSAILLSLGLSAIMPLPPRIFIQRNGLAFGIGNPSVLDVSLAPDDHSVVTALLLLSETAATSWLDKSAPNYRVRKQQIANELIAAIEHSVFPDLRKHIVYMEVATPATFAAYTLAKNGNIYGAARGAWRPGMQSPVQGLLVVGAGTYCGAGIEAVVISGTRAANFVCGLATAA